MSDEDESAESRAARAAAALRQTNRRPQVVRAVRATRELLPGDHNFGDQLSTADDKPSAVIARFLAERGTEAGAELSATREAGLAALQVWQALSQRVGRGAGTSRATILFTDLVGFSSWVLDAGDERGLELLRAVSAVIEPAITTHGGRLVKRLGDGHMAAFADPREGVDAALEMQEGVAHIEVAGHRPSLRAGLHLGQPRQLGGDYLGTDVNIAARLSEAAAPNEVLVSGVLLPALDGDPSLERKRRRWFRAKGTPRDLEVYSVRRVS
ncbi:MAG: adenylate/guanylate cyclase domain-containing protein [Solirubrobacterales bacterium]|nr:adenylate/guanylate cyclase domain-containing protein [Solirubrobacterales bacterium]